MGVTLACGLFLGGIVLASACANNIGWRRWFAFVVIMLVSYIVMLTISLIK